MYYLIYDVFPDKNSRALKKYVGAHVGCWINVFDKENADLIARKYIEEQGWIISSLIENEKINRNDYIDSTDGLEYFEQALIDNEVFVFHTVEKQYIQISKNITDININSNDGEPYNLFLENAIQKKEVWGLVSDDQWANGVTPDGDDFFPLWSSAEAANSWLIHWKGFAPSAISVKELIESLLLNIHEEDLLVAVNYLPANILVTHHPIAVKRDIEKSR